MKPLTRHAYFTNINELIKRRDDVFNNCPFHGKPVTLFSKSSDRFYCSSCPYTDTKAFQFEWHSHQPVVPYDLSWCRGVEIATNIDGRLVAYIFCQQTEDDDPPEVSSLCVGCGRDMCAKFITFQFCSMECMMEVLAELVLPGL